MFDRPDEQSPPAGSDRLSKDVGAKESRKVRARRTKDRTLWHGLGAAGIIGWSIAVPTLIGGLLGRWLDRNQPGDFSWSLALLLAGVTLGCLNAWYWGSLESRITDEGEKDDP